MNVSRGRRVILVSLFFVIALVLTVLQSGTAHAGQVFGKPGACPATIIPYFTMSDGQRIRTNAPGDVGRSLWTEETKNSTFFDPKIAIVGFNDGLFFNFCSTIELSVGECGIIMWNWIPIRVCARVLNPRDEVSYPYKSLNEVFYSQNTIINKRPVMCGYDDPLDYTDLIPDFSYFHYLTTREQAKAISDELKDTISKAENQARSAGKLVIGGLGGVIIPIFGSAVGGLIAEKIVDVVDKNIFPVFNSIVTLTIGCQPIPIGPFPPPYPHDITTDSKLYNVLFKMPLVKEVEPPKVSTFFKPMVEVVLDPEDPTLRESQFLTYKDGEPNPPNGPQCAQFKGGRTFCAKIPVTSPNKLCVYEPGINARGNTDEVVGCVDRPDYMPKPEVYSPEDNTFFLPKIGVKYGPADDPKEIKDEVLYAFRTHPDFNPGSNAADINFDKQCKIMHGVMFCASNDCLEVSPEGKCTKFDKDVCLSGYDSGLEVAVKPAEGQLPTAAPAIEGAPNKLHPDLGVWYYDGGNSICLEYCVKYDADKNCIQEDPAAGKCTKPGISNPLGDGQVTRPVSAKELGLCVKPYDDREFVLREPGDYPITVPDGCRTMSVTAVGAGGAGSNEATVAVHEDRMDYSGGAGAVVFAQIDVSRPIRYTYCPDKTLKPEDGCPMGLKDTYVDPTSILVAHVGRGAGHSKRTYDGSYRNAYAAGHGEDSGIGFKDPTEPASSKKMVTILKAKGGRSLAINNDGPYYLPPLGGMGYGPPYEKQFYAPGSGRILDTMGASFCNNLLNCRSLGSQPGGDGQKADWRNGPNDLPDAVPGGAAYGYEGQPASMCMRDPRKSGWPGNNNGSGTWSPGAGGCTSDAFCFIGCDENLGVSGEGGHGLIKIQCTR